jgi:hypothetical protein
MVRHFKVGTNAVLQLFIAILQHYYALTHPSLRHCPMGGSLPEEGSMPKYQPEVESLVERCKMTTGKCTGIAHTRQVNVTVHVHCRYDKTMQRNGAWRRRTERCRGSERC